MKRNLHFQSALLFLLFCCLQQAHGQSAGFNSTFIVLDINNGGNAYFDLQAATGNPDFQGSNLGNFCEGSSNGIILKGAEHNVYKCGSCDLTNTRLYYSIYPTGSPSGSFVSNTIGYSLGNANGCGGADQRWSDTAYATNLLSGLTPGNYTIEVYSDASTTCFGTIFASNNSNNYKATFTVSGNLTYYVDSDGDGFGNNAGQQVSCMGTPIGYAANNTDCNDNQLQYLDSDGDGFGSNILVGCGVPNNSDCNDAQLQYLDADADGFGANTLVGCGVANNGDCNDGQFQYLDSDGDGFGSVTLVGCGVPNNSDCNDNQLQYLDADGDGFGRNTLVACGVTSNSDCNDDQIQYLDADGDGFGSTIQVACGLANNLDCNDNQLQYLDADGDGFGRNTYVACGVINNSDCNDDQIQYLDADGDGFGSTIQVACGLANNLDCNDTQLQYLDADGDGFGRNTYVACGVINNSDCNDDQIQYLDSDGDGFGSTIQVACGLANNLDCNDTQLQYLDADGDGFGRNTYVACGVTNNSDCNDDQIQYSDSDGDGFGSDIQVACGLANSNDCDDNQLQYLDADGDTFGRNTLVACGVTNNTDCNDDQIQYLDFDGDSFGSNTQVACGVTNNIDCNDNQLQYLDADADGFGSNATVACGVANNIDCNDDQLRYADTDGDGFGSMLKVSCNGVLSNTDCNDGDVLVWQSNALYIDEDQDGYDGGTEIVCYGAAVPVPYMETTNGFDCNDNNNTVHPGVFEILDNGIDDDCNGMTDAVPYCTVPTTWNGTVWSNNYPVADQPAIIAGNFTAISDLQACSLTVTNNAQVVVLGGNDFKITGAVVVDPGSTLTFESNANLVQVDQSTNSGNIKVKRATTMRRLDYTYWASPVNNQMLLSFSPQTIANRFMTIDETSNAFVQQNAATTSFAPAVGYAIRAPNNFTTTPSTFTGIFTGVPRNGDYSILASMNNQGYNLIGNPYPSTVDGNLFLAENPGTMYFWTHNNQAAGSGENYSTYTTIGGTASASGSVEPNGSIQVGQGFVFRPDAPGMANFTNAMRIGNNQNQFFRTAQTEKHRIWLNLAEGESPANQMLVAYATNATVGEDAAMDGRMMPTNSSSISSLINNGEFVIQARPVPFEITDEVPLSFNAATNGTYTISIDHTDGLFSGDQHIFLRDNLSGAVHDLKNSAYSFASVSGSFTARFSIIYQNAPLEIQNPSINEYSIVAFKRDGVLHIESGSATMERIKVFDVRGRQLLEKDTVRSNNFVLNDLRAEQQVLIVQVTDDHGVTVSKKVVF